MSPDDTLRRVLRRFNIRAVTGADMRRFLARATLIAATSALSTMASAHHSSAMFDMEKLITVNGTVKEFQYTNPHSWLMVVATDADGKDVEWSFESEGPSSLHRAGIKPSSLVAGDKVSVTTHPMKDGRTAGTWLKVTKSDGTVLEPRPAPPPRAKPPGAKPAGEIDGHR